MASLVSLQPYPLSPFPGRTRARARSPLSNQTHFGFCTKISSPLLRRKFAIARLGPSGDFLDFEAIEGFAHKLFDRAEGIVYTIADASVSPTDTAIEGSSKTGDWLSGITNYMETVLKVLKDGLSALHVPYAYGFAIILLTVIVKAATFPLTKKQVESALAMRSLQPQVKAIQERYAGDPERIQLETARLYKLAGVNPLAGCLPTLATIPIWIGLYRALSNVADEGLLTGGFFWIPSLAGPTTVAARQSGSGISWLFPFVDGHPPLGWPDTLAYLVLPVLLVVSQYISAQIIQPSQSSDPGQKGSQAVTKLLPLMIGYFALSVPSGLSLYWFTNNILSTAQQIWLQKLGGAKNLVNEYNDKKIRGEPSNIQKSITDIEKSVLPIETIEKPSQGDNADSGLRPGERFKQLREQEARRRKQREEEEKRKEEEAAANFRITIEHQHLEVEPLEDNDEQGSEHGQTKQREENRNEEETAASFHITTEHQNMGAESSEGKPEQVSEESRTKLNMSATNNGGLNSNGGSAVKDKGSIHKDNLKDEVSNKMHASTGSQTHTGNTLDERDQESK